jgi:endonuclease YncB( thermonuclease family)
MKNNLRRGSLLFLVIGMVLVVGCRDKHFPGALVIEEPVVSDIDSSGFTLLNYKKGYGPVRVELLGIETLEYNPEDGTGERCGKIAYGMVEMFAQYPDARFKLYDIKEIGKDEIEAYIFVQSHNAYKEIDAFFIQGELLRQGWARIDDRELPDSKVTELLRQLDKEGKESKRGIWSTNMCNDDDTE